jgi:2-polyprenyl-6-methoxyphenol hydroxylase-like FAD-dependent oxidoreductase
MRAVVRIAGGGPAGLLLAVLLGRHPELEIHVHERAAEPERWSARSYAIRLNERGLRALDVAGMGDDIRAHGLRSASIEMHSADGRSVVSARAEGISLDRPTLVSRLAARVEREGCATVHMGQAVDAMRGRSAGGAELDDALELELSDGTSCSCSHVVGCDGKFSRVRASALTHAPAAGFAAWSPALVEEESWGVLLEPEERLAGDKAPLGLDRMHIYQPREPHAGVYALAVPLGLGGRWHATVVLSDCVLGTEPSLAPLPTAIRPDLAPSAERASAPPTPPSHPSARRK